MTCHDGAATILLEIADHFESSTRIDEQHHETTASGSRDLSGDQAVVAGDLERIFDLGRADLSGDALLRIPAQAQRSSECIEVSGHQGVLHLQSLGTNLVGGVDCRGHTVDHIALLLFDDARRRTGHSTEVEQDRRFEIGDDVIANAQTVGDDSSVFM